LFIDYEAVSQPNSNSEAKTLSVSIIRRDSTFYVCVSADVTVLKDYFSKVLIILKGSTV